MSSGLRSMPNANESSSSNTAWKSVFMPHCKPFTCSTRSAKLSVVALGNVTNFGVIENVQILLRHGSSATSASSSDSATAAATSISSYMDMEPETSHTARADGSWPAAFVSSTSRSHCKLTSLGPSSTTLPPTSMYQPRPACPSLSALPAAARPPARTRRGTACTAPRRASDTFRRSRSGTWTPSSSSLLGASRRSP
eukprot:scaffold55810_cov60-Phaeocystis_antarctica.AAC.3